MKYFILFILLTSNLYSQVEYTFSDSANQRTGLSPDELKKAKDMFKQMAFSEDYKRFIINSKLEVEMLNGVELIDLNTIIAVKGTDSVGIIMRQRLAENLHKTKFKSVDEGMKLHAKSTALLAKMRVEYPELHEMMNRATSKQFREIREPIHEVRRQIMLEN